MLSAVLRASPNEGAFLTRSLKPALISGFFQASLTAVGLAPLLGT